MRRAICFFLVIALIFCLSFAGYAEAPEVCFLAVNDTVLDLSMAPFYYNGTYYAPYTVFGNLKVYSSYFATSNTISLYSSGKQLYINLDTGRVFDSDDNYYIVSTARKNGITYVSIPFICSFFDLNWSYIEGIGYGNVLRITNASSYLTDSEFLRAASSVMQPRYESYIQSLTSSANPIPTEPGTPDPSDIPVYLSFEGLPGDAILSTLQRYSVKAAFYLSPCDIAANPDTVRRIYGSGHSIGIYCGSDPASDYAEASALLLDAANIRTVLVSSSGENLSACQSFAAEQMLKMVTYDMDAADRYGYGISSGSITNRISNADHTIHLRFNCTESTQQALGSILSFLSTNNYDLRLEREV